MSMCQALQNLALRYTVKEIIIVTVIDSTDGLHQEHWQLRENRGQNLHILPLAVEEEKEGPRGQLPGTLSEHEKRKIKEKKCWKRSMKERREVT